MKRIWKRTATLLTVAALAATTVAGCGIKKDEEVAKIGDATLTAGVANFYARYQAAGMETYYGSYYGDDMWTQEYTEGKTMEEEIKTNVMDSLQELYLLDAHKDEYKVTLSDDEMKVIEEAAAKFDKANKDKVKNKISGDKEVVTEVLRLLTVQSKMREAMVADIDREVSDDEAAQKSMQYVAFSFTKTDADGNSVDLTDEEKATLKKEAESFAKEAKKAKDFEALAKEKNLTAETATFDSESTTPAKELVEAADKLKKGKTTDLVETENGYYVAKLTSTFDREATDKKKEEIISQRESDRYSELLEEWKKATEIKVYDKVWDKISFQDLKVEMKVKETEK